MGIVWNPDGESKSVIRAGYGIFYDRTLLGTVDNFLTDYKYSPSFTANFPAPVRISVPGTARSRPTRCCRSLSPDVSQAQREHSQFAVYPPGSTVRNSAARSPGTIPNRQQPYFHQFSVGYEREIFQGVSASVDYMQMNGRDMFFNPNLNIALGTDTVRDGPRQDPAPDPFGVLRPSLAPGEARYAPTTTVRLLTTEYGYSDYDALNVSVEKRYSNNFSARAAILAGLSRGITAGQGDTPQLQTWPISSGRI